MTSPSNSSFPLRWDIPHFSTVTLSKKLTLTDSKIPNLINLYFRLFPKLSVPNMSECISLLLCSDIPMEDELKVSCDLGIIDQKGTKRCSRENLVFVIPKGKNNPVCGGTYFVNRDYLLDSENGLLVEDTLKIHCKMKILDKELGFQILQKDEFGKVTENLGLLLDSGKFSDSIVIVGDQEFRVHKAILGTRSPVFGAMFEHDCVEKRQNRIEITDVSVQVFELLLRFIYTGKIPNIEEEYVLDLFVASDKYQLESLKKICEQSMSATLSVDSVANVLLFADMHNAHALKQKCLRFCNDNADKVLLTDGWTALKKCRADLVVELYEMRFSSAI